MKNRVFFITTIFVLLIAANAFGGLSGVWKLNVHVANSQFGVCEYEDPQLVITQQGTLFTGIANLAKIGVGGCPPTLMGTIQGNASPDPTISLGPFFFSWVFPEGPFNIFGQFTDPIHANGTFNGLFLGKPASGTWALNPGPQGAPTLTHWGRNLLIILAVLGGIYYLRRRRTAVS